MPKPVPIGTVVTRNCPRDGVFQRIKTVDGWKNIPKDEAHRYKRKPKTQPMPKRNNPRKIAADKPKPIKRTGMTEDEKLAAGWRYVLVCARPKQYALRHPDKLTA